MSASIKMLLDGMPRLAWGETREPIRAKAVGIAMVGASDHHFLALNELRSVLASFFCAHPVSPGLYFSRGKLTSALEDVSEAWRIYGAAVADAALFIRGSAAMQALRPLINEAKGISP
jgi:FMN reductase